MGSHRYAVPGAVLLTALTIVAYLPALSAGTIWDDSPYLTENETLRDAKGLREIWLRPGATEQYYPAVFTSFWIERRIWGERLFGYHLTNVLLHALNGLLLWTLLRRLAVPGAWLAGAVFALHPIHVESVAWIAERKDVLSGFFFFLTVLCWIRYRESRRASDYALSLASGAAALLAKTAVAPLPLALLLLVAWREKRLGTRELLPIAPFLLLSVGLGLLHVRLEEANIGRTYGDFGFSLPERFLIAGTAFWFYIGKIVWPDPLLAIYPRWSVLEAPLASSLLLAAAVFAPLVLWRARARIGTGPVVVLLFYAIMIAPALGLLSQAFLRFSFVADHFQYIAGVGISSLAVAIGVRLLSRRPGAVVLPILLLPVLGALTFRQAGYYADNETLFRHTLKHNPEAWVAQSEVGKAHLTRGEYREARDHFEAAARRMPSHPGLQGNLGLALAGLGDHEAALSHFRRAVEEQPDAPGPHLNLGTSLLALERLEEAIGEFEAAYVLDSTRVSTLSNLGLAYARRGELDRAALYTERAIELAPGLYAPYVNLAEIRMRQGNRAEAERLFRAAIELEPNRSEALDGLAALQSGW